MTVHDLQERRQEVLVRRFLDDAQGAGHLPVRFRNTRLDEVDSGVTHILPGPVYGMVHADSLLRSIDSGSSGVEALARNLISFDVFVGGVAFACGVAAGDDEITELADSLKELVNRGING